MHAEPARQAPDLLDGIECGIVRRQEVEAEPVAAVSQLGREAPGVVMPRAVCDKDHDGPRALMPLYLLEEGSERLPVQRGRLPSDQLAGGQANGTEQARALARGSVQHDRIPVLRGHPHRAPRAMLLEVHLIEGPQVHGVASGEVAEFFYIPPG